MEKRRNRGLQHQEKYRSSPAGRLNDSGARTDGEGSSDRCQGETVVARFVILDRGKRTIEETGVDERVGQAAKAMIRAGTSEDKIKRRP